MEWRATDQIVVVPKAGRLTITGFDGGLNPPGERMITNRYVQRGSVGNLELVESSWLGLELTTANGGPCDTSADAENKLASAGLALDARRAVKAWPAAVGV